MTFLVLTAVQVVGSIEDSQARLLIGSILLAILVLSLSQKFLSSPTAEAGKPSVPAYAQSVWFAGLVGVVGGFATILTNSMGPILNVYLLALQLGPSEFVGTRVCTCFGGTVHWHAVAL